MTEINTTEIMLDLIRSKTDRLGSSKLNEAWVILFEGKQISLQNGKYLWRKINHAKTALTNMIKWKFEQDLRKKGFEYLETNEIYYDSIDQLQKDGLLEFRRLL